jgi:hypothetical protein
MCEGEEMIPLKPYPTDGEVLARFDARHAHTLVWVIRFEYEPDIPRLLAPAAHDARDADEHGYTSDPRRALPDEPEAVAAVVLDEFAKANDRRHRDFLNGELTRTLASDLGFERRLRILREHAHRHGVNVRDDVQVIVRGWQTLDVDALERRLAAIEAKVRARIEGERTAA